MDIKTFVGILGLVAGTGFILIGLFASHLPRQKRLILAYVGVCFYAFGALEYFGVIHLESLR